jgi:uncharacterized protein
MTAELLIEELQNPTCYPDHPSSVQIVQTHLSVVCLAGEFVYKLKKAKTLPFVDFAPLTARRGFCREEVRLNRRLCPDTYLGTCALRRTASGVRFTVLGDDESTEDIDIAVVMKRLPAARMLDELVRNHTATIPELETLARQVATFHAKAERSPAVLAAGSPHALAGFARANFDEMVSIPDHGVPHRLLAALARATDAAFARQLPILEARAARGLVVDGHGDLHARNVCMTDPPTIYDCIEFAPAFRCGDIATENAFLVMDLRYRDAPELATAYENAYIAVTGDMEQRRLLPMLCSYRAMVRAKVAALSAIEPELPAADRQGARESALRHVLLAAAMTAESGPPMWIVMCGPPASGKSTLCGQLAKIAHWPHLANDFVRKQLAGIAPTERASPEFYSAAFSDRTYAEVAARAVAASATGQPAVLIDGNFATPARRASIAATANTHGIAAIFVHLDIDQATAQKRATRRAQDPENISDAGPQKAVALHAQFVAPAADENLTVVRTTGTQSIDALVEDVLRQLLHVRNPQLAP